MEDINYRQTMLVERIMNDAAACEVLMGKPGAATPQEYQSLFWAIVAIARAIQKDRRTIEEQE